MQFTAEVVLAVVAAATGTLAILGVIAFFLYLYYQHRLRKERRRSSNNNNKRRNQHDDFADITTPNDTRSDMTNDEDDDLDADNPLADTNVETVLSLEDDSVVTFVQPPSSRQQSSKNQQQPAWMQPRPAQDLESCYGDDSWSYAVTEEGSVLVAQELSLQKQGLHAPTASSSSSKATATNHKTTNPVPVYFQDQDGNSVMYEV